MEPNDAGSLRTYATEAYVRSGEGQAAGSPKPILGHLHPILIWYLTEQERCG